MNVFRYSLAIALLLISPALQAQEAPTLDGLLAQFRAMPGLSAHYVEEKRMALLVEPLVNEGMIYFVPPGRLVRRTEKPLAQVLLIDGSALAFGDEKGGEKMDLDSNPVVRLFVDSFLKILAGDRAALERMYTISLGAHGEGGWALQLKPKLAPMDKVIASLVLHGKGVALVDMTVTEIGGDTTLTRFAEVNTKRRFSEAELHGLFSVPKSWKAR